MTTVGASELLGKAREAKAASRQLAKLPSAVKDRALANTARLLKEREEQVLAANEEDYRQSKHDGLSESLLDRLLLTPERLGAIAADVLAIADLPDPVGETFDMRRLPNGLEIGKRRVPLGVIGSIYESRPNVTIDISALCLKSGNAVVLRGGKEALRSNQALAAALRDAIAEAGAPAAAVQLVESTDRALVDEMLGMREHIDLMVPRGSEALIRRVAAGASMPVIAGGVGVCHTYVDVSAEGQWHPRLFTMPRSSAPAPATPWIPCWCTGTSRTDCFRRSHGRWCATMWSSGATPGRWMSCAGRRCPTLERLRRRTLGKSSWLWWHRSGRRWAG